MSQAKIVVCLIYNSSTTHCQHTTKEHAVHTVPTEQSSSHITYTYHSSHNETSTDNGRKSHLHNLLEREFKAQGEHQYNHTYLSPLLAFLHISYSWSIGHIRSCQETGNYVSKYKRLLQFLEQYRSDSCHYKYVCKVSYQSRKCFLHLVYYI